MKRLEHSDWDTQEVIDIFLAVSRNPAFKAWRASTGEGVQIQDSKFIGIRLPIHLRDLYEETNKELGLGYSDLCEFTKDAVRRRLEEAWSVFRSEKVLSNQ